MKKQRILGSLTLLIIGAGVLSVGIAACNLNIPLDGVINGLTGNENNNGTDDGGNTDNMNDNGDTDGLFDDGYVGS